ncbi:MAG: hypothetical protein AAF845_17600 [Bacteroidota bacterium]
MAAAALVVGGGSPLGRAVVARLAAVTRVAIGEVDPGDLAPALAEADRVRLLYGRDDLPALVVAEDPAGLVRSARRLLPSGFGVVLVTPPPSLRVDAIAEATAPGTPLVLVERGHRAETARRSLGDGRTLWTVATAVPGWDGTRGSTASEVHVARTVRDLLFPAPDLSLAS